MSTNLTSESDGQLLIGEKPELEQQIVQLINKIEDEFLHESLYSEAAQFLETIQNQEIRSDPRIRCIEARVLIYDDPSRSEKLFSELYEKNPYFFRNTFEYLTLLFDSYEGKAEEVQKKVHQLLQNYQKDESTDEGYFLACMALAVKSQKNMKPSRKYMEQAIVAAKKPFQKSDMYSQLGNTYLEVEDYQNAMKFYKEGLKLQPKNDECLNNISFCYLEMHDLQKSILFGELALQNYPYNSTVLCNLAIVYEELNQIDKAEDAYIRLFQNKSIGSVQHSNYAQFLIEHRIDLPEKRLLIIQNLTKGFTYDPTRQNSIFTTFYMLLKITDQFAQMMYSYQPMIYLTEFIETIRMISPHILGRMGLKVQIYLMQVKEQEAEDEFEDVSGDEEEEEDDDEEMDEEEHNPNQQQNNLEQPQLKQLTSLDEDDKYVQVQQKVVQSEEKIQEEHQPYLDPTLKKPITSHQKVLLYTLVHDLIKLKMRENSTILAIIIYQRQISQNLHFQSEIQLWDLYID